MHLVRKSMSGKRQSTNGRKEDDKEKEDLSPPPKIFPQYKDCGEEIRRHILSFVASGPMEERDSNSDDDRQSNGYYPGTLTSILPLVNRECHQLANLDIYWEPVFKRQLTNPHHGSLWVEGLQRLLPMEEYNSVQQQRRQQRLRQQQQPQESSSVQGDAALQPLQLLKQVRTHLTEEEVSYKQLYQNIFTGHIQFSAPVFAMSCHLQLGQVYGLHLFEPRYRIMMHELMQATENPEAASTGGPILPTVQGGMVTPPMLIHANLGTRLVPGEHACLVQVLHCNTYGHGQADVQLLPVAWCRLERIWVRPNAGQLFCARATRLAGSVQEFYNSVSS
jgi:hypothetical protein